ncbi:MAG: Ribonuclease BN [Chlamydiae bacterium]|nr:Ribonuclease BN [Chlamydiota bacterium]
MGLYVQALFKYLTNTCILVLLMSCDHANTSKEQVALALPTIVPKVPVVESSAGKIQFGSPPEIAKEWMRQQEDIPTIYVLPDPMLRDKVNFGDVEFPIYWNSFVKGWLKKGKCITLIGSFQQIENTKKILQETIFGPTRFHLEQAGHPQDEVERVLRESYHFAVKDSKGMPYPLEAFVHFLPFDETGTAYMSEDVSIHARKNDQFLVRDGGKEIKVQFQALSAEKCKDYHFPTEPFTRPYFGMTHIGTSSGFDPYGLTSCSIIWVNNKGLLIDPLAYIGLHLEVLGIQPGDVPDVFLTHIHGDHDAGLIEYILLGQKIRLYTTRIIYESFLRKAKAITGQDFDGLVDFIELAPNEKREYREGFMMTARNNFHSIPTIGLLIESPSGTTCFYSGDTYYVPEDFEKYEKNGLMTKQRIQELMMGFDADYVFHEGGIAPIHTPLEPLIKASRQRTSEKNSIVLVHKSQPKGRNKEELKVASSGEQFVFEERKKDPILQSDCQLNNH